LNHPQELDPGATQLLPEVVERHFGPVPPPVQVRFGAASHVGLRRTNNEDHFLVIERRRARKVLLTNLPADALPPHDDVGYLLAVADGMGGAAFGELASSLALQSAWEQSPGAVKWTWIVTDREVQDIKCRAEIVFRRIDETLRERARLDPACAGMGTTLTGVYTVGPEAFLAHTGDSRAYLWLAGTLSRLTRDHTLAQQCADLNLPVLKQSWNHMLTHCLGAGQQQVRVDFQHLQLGEGSRLLLCTDGLSDLVSDADIATVLGREADPQAAAQALVDLALSRGGLDNVTAVVAHYAMA
jgi:protein phosphatase